MKMTSRSLPISLIKKGKGFVSRSKELMPQCLSGAVVSMSHYKSAGQSSMSDEGSQHTAYPAVHLPKQVGHKWLPRETWGNTDVTVALCLRVTD